jgi:hypothetical protein
MEANAPTQHPEVPMSPSAAVLAHPILSTSAADSGSGGSMIFVLGGAVVAVLLVMGVIKAVAKVMSVVSALANIALSIGAAVMLLGGAVVVIGIVFLVAVVQGSAPS